MSSLSELFFRPRSVLVYGASSDPDKLSGRPLDYLKKFGYPGAIYALNPRRTVVQGVPAYPDVDALPGPVDLAVVVVPAESVLDALERCASVGVGAAVVFASGFAEVGEAGHPAQERIRELVRTTGMRVLGPNCLGAFSAPGRTYSTFSTAFDDEGDDRPDSPVALVAQSGAVGTFTYSTMNALGLGVRYFVNTGNEVDITVIEVLRELVDASDVELLLGHLEDGQDTAGLEDLAAAAQAAGKPLVVLKAGHTPAGSRAVAAHTASVAGDDAAIDSMLARHGAVRVRGMEEMADTAIALAAGRKATGRRLTIVTLSGGAGALTSDAATEAGLTVDTWQNAVDRDKLRARLPYFASNRNPIDVTGAMINDIDSLADTLHIVSNNEDTDLTLIVLGNADRTADEIVDVVTAAYRATDKPMLVSWTGGSGRPRTDLLRNGVPTYTDPRRAVAALAALVRNGMAELGVTLSP